jgi:hypothetical protein
MILLVFLSGCTWISPFDKFSEDKDACEQVARGSSPYANTTGGAVNDQWTACMKDHGWRNVEAK